MPQYTFTAFRWTGQYYNALYNSSYTAVFDDDDAHMNGGSDANETVSINGGSFGATNGSPYDIDVSFTDTGGNPHVETFHFFHTAGNWYFIPGPGSAFTVGATLGSYQSHTTTPTPYSSITCFVRGTLIETDRGAVCVEDLHAGALVVTADGSAKPLRMALSRRLSFGTLRQNPQLMPVRISAGALGNGLPRRDLLVSRQHRMLVSSVICERMFGARDVLVSAIRLTGLPGIYTDTRCTPVEYFHLVFDQHEVIFAEGAPSESFFTGPEALKSLTPEAREEILSLYPQLSAPGYIPQPAFHIPSGKRQKSLIARHTKNNLAICAGPARPAPRPPGAPRP